MMHSWAPIFVALLSSSTTFASSRPDHPAEQTQKAEPYDVNLAEGWSPRPTDGPKAIFGRMDLQPRIDGYTMGPATCGFIPSNNNEIACLTAGDVCSYQSGYAGCCEPNRSCSPIKKRCYDYTESLSGSCRSLSDFHTVCCRTRASGRCFTWEISMTGGGDKPSGVFTLFDCSSTSGSGTLLNYDPLWLQTHTPTDTPTRTPTRTPTPTADPTSSPSPTETESGGSKTNVGAIAGGTVGGLAAVALVGTAAFFLFRRKKDDGKASTNKSSPPPAPMQQPYSPASQNQHPGSPGSQTHYSQQPYDPHMSTYSQQPYDPHMSTYSQQPYAPQQGYQQPYNGQHPQQQWSGYGHTPSFSGTGGSPGPYTTPSPGAPSPGTMGGPQQHVGELQSVNPIGMGSNRAELS